MVRVRRAFSDALLSIAGLSVLVAVLVSVNQDVRDQVARRLTSTQAVRSLASTAGNLASGMFRTARSQSIGYASLVVFVAAACLLVAFMLRV